MRHTVRQIVCIALLAVFAWGPAAGRPVARNRKASDPAPATAAQNGKDPSSAAGTEKPPPATSTLGGDIVAALDVNASDPDDHVPCLLTVKQLNVLQPISGVPHISEADQSSIMAAVAKAIQSTSSASMTETQKLEFLYQLDSKFGNKLIGKTPGEALTTIMIALYQIQHDPATEKISQGLEQNNPQLTRQGVLEKAAETGGNEYADKLARLLPIPEPTWKAANDADTRRNIAALIEQSSAAPSLATAEKAAASKTAHAVQAQSLPTDVNQIRQQVTDSARLNGGDALAALVYEKLSPSPPGWFASNNPGRRENIDKSAQDAATTPSEKKAADAIVAATNNAGTNKTAGAVVDAARAAVNKFVRPDDIGCAMQILSYDETRLMFGRSVADEFIAVQVTVRNLNAKEEFLVHNAEMRVQTDIHGALTQYFEGVDKIGVEAYNNTGEALTKRGIAGNAITAAGALLSALQPIVNVTTFANAVAAFNGGVVPGFKTLVPDHQKDQLLMIANYGFSATNNFKSVVPKSSAATFYTWFPAKPFNEGWWLQDCAVGAARGGVSSPNRPQLVVDLQSIETACRQAEPSQWATTPYKKWSATSDQLFRDISFVIVAGIHVREDSKNAGSVTDLKCPKDSQGRLDFSKASDTGTLSCDVSGASLDKFTKLRLENAGNLVDPVRPDGTLSDFGTDNSSAKVTFAVSDLKGAAGDSYNVFAVGKDGSETNTGKTVYLNQSPSISSVKPSPLGLKTGTLQLTISGSSLDKLKSVCFKGDSGNKSASPPSAARSTSFDLNVTSLGLTKGTWNVYADQCPSTSSSKDISLQVVDGQSK